MKHFDPSLWNNSDPLCAPCLSSGGRNNNYGYWVAPRKYVKAGWVTKRIPVGQRESKKNPPCPIMASKCRELTRELVHWYEGADAPKIEPGTWKWLIGRYESETHSPIHSTKANTREGYRYWLRHIEDAIGHVKIAETDYTMLMDIRTDKEAKGRSTHHVHYWFNTLRRVARYGILIKADGAAEVATVMANVRIPAPPARTEIATREQVEAIVAEADRLDHDVWAAGILLQFWFHLRSVEVRGHYLDGEWCDGLTWDMFDDGFTSFTKVISKTRKSLQEPYTFDLRLTPDIRARLIAIHSSMPEHLKRGPVTINRRTGRPYTVSGWGHCWSRLREAAGIPKEV